MPLPCCSTHTRLLTLKNSLAADPASPSPSRNRQRSKKYEKKKSVWQQRLTTCNLLRPWGTPPLTPMLNMTMLFAQKTYTQNRNTAAQQLGNRFVSLPLRLASSVCLSVCLSFCPLVKCTHRESPAKRWWRRRFDLWVSQQNYLFCPGFRVSSSFHLPHPTPLPTLLMSVQVGAT